MSFFKEIFGSNHNNKLHSRYTNTLLIYNEKTKSLFFTPLDPFEARAGTIPPIAMQTSLYRKNSTTAIEENLIQLTNQFMMNCRNAIIIVGSIANIPSPPNMIKMLKFLDDRKDFEEKLIDIWEKEVIPSWNEKIYVKMAYDHGVPHKLRHLVWTKAIGNNLNITEQLFRIFLAHAASIVAEDDSTSPSSSSSSPTFYDSFDTVSDCAGENRTGSGTALQKSSRPIFGNEKTVTLISVDLPRTNTLMPEIIEECRAKQKMKGALEAYVCYRPDIGYVQGMSYIASVLAALQELESVDIFICLANLLNRDCLRTFYSMNVDSVSVYVKLYERLFQEYVPKVSNHLRALSLNHDLYLYEWVLTLFSQILPVKTCFRIWDCILTQGDFFIFKVVLGIMKVISKTLLEMEFEEAATLLSRGGATLSVFLDENSLFEAISKISLTKKKYNLILKQLMQ